MKNNCKLCGRRRDLCRSHITPEWAYRPVYDADSRALALSSEERRYRKVQQGLWERLFCSDCEQFFNRLDQPFHRFWAGPDRFPRVFEKPFIVVDGIDYKLTRRFLLSVLWRAHVATSPAVSAVNLGPHADRIRCILRKRQGDTVEGRYPIFCYALQDPKTGAPATRLVLTPVRTRTQGRWNYKVAFLGCAWDIFVSNQAPPLPMSCMLNQDGTIVMPVVRYDEFPAIRRLLKVHAI